MRFVSKRVEIEAEEIEHILHAISDGATVKTKEGRTITVVSSQPIKVGDFINVTDSADIYHMPRRICVGACAKYEPVVINEGGKDRHVSKALAMMENPAFIGIENATDIKGVAPVVSFTVQSDPIGEVGVNGCQASDMLEYVKCLFQSLNSAFPCRENSLTITKLEETIHWQASRTADRTKRGVEGANKE